MTDWATGAAISILAVAIALGAYRLVHRRSTTADRVVALDLLVTLFVAATTVLAVRTDRREFLDLAVVLSLTGFVMTSVIGRFVGRGGLR